MAAQQPLDMRTARLFRNNRSQAVRIPAEFEFASDRVRIRKEGDALIIEPEPRRGLIALLETLEPLANGDQLPSDLRAGLASLDAIDL